MTAIINGLRSADSPIKTCTTDLIELKKMKYEIVKKIDQLSDQVELLIGNKIIQIKNELGYQNIGDLNKINEFVKGIRTNLSSSLADIRLNRIISEYDEYCSEVDSEVLISVVESWFRKLSIYLLENSNFETMTLNSLNVELCILRSRLNEIEKRISSISDTINGEIRVNQFMLGILYTCIFLLVYAFTNANYKYFESIRQNSTYSGFIENTRA